jgi:hypothetical protein
MRNILATACLSFGLAAPVSPIRLTPLPPADGCGCTFTQRDRTDQPIFSRDLDEEGAMIGVNGRAIRLTRSSFEESRKVPGRISLGDMITEKLKGDGVSVALEYETTFVCPEDDEGCEVTEYCGTLEVSAGKNHRTFKVVGACGC